MSMRRGLKRSRCRLPIQLNRRARLCEPAEHSPTVHPAISQPISVQRFWGNSATCHTENDIDARLFPYWTHAEEGRRLVATPHEGKIKTSETGAGDTKYMNGCGVGGVGGVGGVTRDYCNDPRRARSVRPKRAHRPCAGLPDRSGERECVSQWSLGLLWVMYSYRRRVRARVREPGLDGASSVPSSRAALCGHDTDK
jgi:hypothetical protein